MQIIGYNIHDQITDLLSVFVKFANKNKAIDDYDFNIKYTGLLPYFEHYIHVDIASGHYKKSSSLFQLLYC